MQQSGWLILVAWLSQVLCSWAFTASWSRSNSRTLLGDRRASAIHSLPKLIVFDLDNTIWTPELYQLRKLQRSNTTPRAGRDVHLMAGSQQILENHIPALREQGVQFGVASRTKSVEWAHALLGQFGLHDIFDYVQIEPGNKKRHFQDIQTASGISYDSMLFFDDARDGRYGNCQPVAEMGVLAVHCPNGLETADMFTNALERYKEWDHAAGTIVEADGTITKSSETRERHQGIIKMIDQYKKFGFIRYRNRKSKDAFFHFRHVRGEPSKYEEGDIVSFVTIPDPKNGKLMAAEVSIESSVDKTQVQLNCFSMNQPFAALLANSYKDIETRNGTMFAKYAPGTIMLLHVGKRTYPDGDRHIEVMKGGGLDEVAIQQLKTLPAGFGKGSVVAILELGRTFETTVSERSDPEFEGRAAAFGADSGRLATKITRVAYLRKPVKLAGQPGVFKVRLDKDVIPDGWDVNFETDMTTEGATFATISG